MRVLVLGATGSVGHPVTAELINAGHHVVALSRSEGADEKLLTIGAEPLRGDLRAPGDWAGIAGDVDGIVHAAATFEEDMGDVDARVLSALETAASGRARGPRFIYTGGCWLYGATADATATEDHPFNPPSAFAWMVENSSRLLESSSFSTAVIHPAMVYDASGGVFARFLHSARNGEPIEIWGHARTRWPIVHGADLATAYRLLLERRSLNGSFNASAQSGVAVGHIASVIADHYRSPKDLTIRSVDDIVAEFGKWAEGATLDQQMSSRKLQSLCDWSPKITSFERSDLFD